VLGGTDNHGENDNPKWWMLDSLMKLNGAGLLFFSFCLPNPPGKKAFFFVTKIKAKSFLASACFLFFFFFK